VIERNRYDVAGPHRATRRVDPRSIDADLATIRQGCRSRSGADHPRVPKPLIDPLTIQRRLASDLRVLVALKLRFQRQKLGEGRIGIGLFAAPLLIRTPGPRWPVVVAAIAVTIAIPPWRPAFMPPSLAFGSVVGAVRLFLAGRTFSVRLATGPLLTLGLAMMTATTAVLTPFAIG
jgi:hypothetical protein